MKRGPPHSFGWLLVERGATGHGLPMRDVWEMPNGDLRWGPPGCWLREYGTGGKAAWTMPNSLDIAERAVRLPKGAQGA